MQNIATFLITNYSVCPRIGIWQMTDNFTLRLQTGRRKNLEKELIRLSKQEMTDNNSLGHKNREPIEMVKVTLVPTVDDAGWAPVKMMYTSRSIKFATLTRDY